VEPDTFFMRYVPSQIIAQLPVFARLRGKMSVRIGSRHDYTVALGDLDSPVRRGCESDADLAMTFSDAAFAGFTRGDLDLGAAVRVGEITATGKIEVWEALGRLLTPSMTALQTRLGSGEPPRNRQRAQ
jgi:hypothetical protein